MTGSAKGASRAAVRTRNSQDLRRRRGPFCDGFLQSRRRTETEDGMAYKNHDAAAGVGIRG